MFIIQVLTFIIWFLYTYFFIIMVGVFFFFSFSFVRLVSQKNMIRNIICHSYKAAYKKSDSKSSTNAVHNPDDIRHDIFTYMFSERLPVKNINQNYFSLITGNL